MYSQLPDVIEKNIVIPQGPMMFYQYLPIKLPCPDSFSPLGNIRVPQALVEFAEIIGSCIDDFRAKFGQSEYNHSYIYITAKRMYQAGNCSYNRHGWHCDGFMTNDINYIWCDSSPTIFNNGKFNLTQDDAISIKEMQQQADSKFNKSFPVNTILRLNQYVVHKVSDVQISGIRTFVKISFSRDFYDLIGNSINYELGYKHPNRKRNIERNVPQKI